ncbi:MAG: hypothetical protein AAF725_16090 [Acidobacteriota bacterium]
MPTEKSQQSVGLFILSYLGFLTHLGLETLTLHFSRESINPEEWQGIVDYMMAPSTEWTLAIFALLTMVPVALSIFSVSRATWLATAITGGLMTLLHAAHYLGELSESFGAVGAMSLVFHVVPSAVASWLAWRSSKLAPGAAS